VPTKVLGSDGIICKYEFILCSVCMCIRCFGLYQLIKLTYGIEVNLALVYSSLLLIAPVKNLVLCLVVYLLCILLYQCCRV